MTFRFVPAQRTSSRLLIGLAGPTGSGKTLSALYLASGITAETGGRIAYIDTENGRALQYAPPGEPGIEFAHGSLGAPFSPRRYLEALAAAEKHAGDGGVIVIDSVSHEHEGPGGVLEMHDEIVQEKGQHMQFAAWAQPKAERRKLINRVLQSGCHVILAFRAKERAKQVKVNKNGREVTEIVDIGWQPITGDEWPYEATLFALLNPERKGVPIFDGFTYGKLPINMCGLIPTDRPISAETGRRLAQWAMSGTQRSAVREPEDADLVPLWCKDGDVREMPPAEAAAGLRKMIDSAKSRERLVALWRSNGDLLGRLSEEQREALDLAYQDRLDAFEEVPA